jgi:hypothetical protein
VHRQAQTGFGGEPAVLDELLGVQHQHAAVIRLSLVGLDHGGGERAEGAVSEKLDPAKTQEVVAKAAFHYQRRGMGKIFQPDILENSYL